MTNLPRNTILTGDALTRLTEPPAGTVDCVITSPPYFQLRDYGTPGQLGLEATVSAWVEGLRPVFGQLARVLKPTGSLWLNLGDSFSRHLKYGAPPKGLLLAPERLVTALASDGWLVRNKVIWAKTNPMPSSINDRLTLTYEVVYFLTRSPRYFFDLDAIREPHRTTAGKRARAGTGGKPAWAGPLAASNGGLRRERPDGQPGHWLGKNPGDVWQFATSSFRGGHFATFPTELVRRPLLATCPEAVCVRCGQPWKRRVLVRRVGDVRPTPKPDPYRARYRYRWETSRRVGDLVPCGCDAPTVPGVVADPFFGTGTVGVVACELGLDWLGIELNPNYVRLAEARLAAACGPPGGPEACAA